MSSYAYSAGSGSLSTPAASMKHYYLKSEPQASSTLRHMANGLNAAAYEFFRSPDSFAAPHIGFDLEWKPNFRPGEPENPIAVIQIAYETASYVVHVRWMRPLPDGLAEILENPRIVKVGVGIQNDAKKLYRDLGICLNSCVELSLFVKCVDSGLFVGRLDRYADVPLPPSTPAAPPPLPSDCPPWEFYNSEIFLGLHFRRLFRGHYTASIGLARLAELYEGIVLTKGKITRSNWDMELTPAQIQYAALDAYAGYVVYTHLIKLFNLLEPTRRPKRKFYAFDCIRGTLYHCCGSDKRTLPGEQMQDTDLAGYSTLPIFRPVEEEIGLHLQGVGSDQPRGLVPWTASNPEYDPGPMQPQKTPEEKEAAKKARQQRREEKRKEEQAQNGGTETNLEISVKQTAADCALPPTKVTTHFGANRGHATYAPNRYRATASTVSPTQPAHPSTTSSTSRSDKIPGITSSMQATKISKAPRTPDNIIIPNNQNAEGSNNQKHRRRRPKQRNPSQTKKDVRGSTTM